MKKVIYFCFIILQAALYLPARAQNTIYLQQGRVEFERKENMFARLDDEEWLTDDTKENIKKNLQQFKTTYFDLRFNGNKTLYQPGRETDPYKGMFSLAAADNNTVLTDLENQMSTTEKNVFEDKFLLLDTVRQIQWKITNETRTIAGFQCRRANAIILDSIYVVAFYTDAIPTSGGPESFTGLPGMILGLALPHEHVTWFATKVFAETIPETTFVAPVRGKKTTNVALLKTLQDRLDDWGKEGRTYIKQAAW